MKGVRCFGIKEKIAPRYIGPYPIIDKYGSTSYQVELPVKLSGVHNVFHVSQLKRCLKPLTDVVIEGPEKATRGGEWEPIKIPHRNLAYIPNRTRRTSLLTRPKSPSYRLAIDPQNHARNRSENTELC
jgi:hypothetical protein